MIKSTVILSSLYMGGRHMFIKEIDKKILTVLFLFAALILAVLYLSTTGSISSNVDVEESSMMNSSDAVGLKSTDSTVSINQKTVTTNNVATIAEAKKSLVSQHVRTLAGTPAEAAIVTKWEESRGKFSKESLEDYASYDQDTLIKLANSGDLKAMNALARFYMSFRYTGEYGLEEVMRVSKLGAAYGSTGLLKIYAIVYATHHFQPDSQRLNHEDLIEVLAWSNTAALRGDMYPNYGARDDIKDSGIQLTQEDKVKISARSQEIYNELLAQRKALGLGDFDNTRPPEVDKFFGYLENFMDEIK